MSGYSVKLYVYDLSGGMARQMSQAIVGKQIDGVWHTAVVVYGQEYFFGSGGVCSCPPGGTMMGPPLRVEDMGTTYIPPATFREYLIDISPDFHPSHYNVMANNCNNFTNTVLEFLTGGHTPDYILNLPQEFLATPLGQMLRPSLEQITTQAQAQLPMYMGGATGLQFYVNENAIPDVFECKDRESPMEASDNVTTQKQEVKINEDEGLD